VNGIFSWRMALLGVLAGAISLAGLAALPVEAGAASVVSCPETISTPGTYVLTSTCAGFGSNGAAITITSSDVTLKLNGQTIDDSFVGVLIDDTSAAISGVAIKGPA